MSDEHLRYPVGKFQPKESYTSTDIQQFIAAIEAAPEKLTQAFQKLTPKQLDTPYREGGWTARQVLHHLADSHMHAYIRFKWTLTENSPTIKAYYEKLWAETYEVAQDPALSISLLKALHAKWITLLRALTPSGKVFRSSRDRQTSQA
ncbi:MAG TPA: putative metal-dependent hydrolase [Cyclobacteriaceae bacterium]|nr:putative metal-dependent hydrolase [Cyclobacteriaceae bacterium]